MTNTTILTANIRIAPTGMMEALPASPLYRLKKEFMAIHFDRGGHGHIILLPKGAELEVVGTSCVSECLEVRWDDGRYNVFEVDLLGTWSQPIAAIRSKVAQLACA